MSLDITAAANILTPIVDRTLHQQLYSYDKAHLNPGFVSMRREQGKQTPFGEGFEMTVQIGGSGATSGSYSVAHTNMGSAAPTFKKFAITPTHMFTKGKITGQTIDRCKDQGGLVNAMSFTVKDTMRSHMRKLCVLSGGTGSGALARITAVAATYVEVSSAFASRFEVGDKLVAAAAETSGGLRSATACGITGIDEEITTGTARLTLDTDPTGLSWSAASSGDYLFWEGCRNAVYIGHSGWAPATAPGATTFFGVDRTAHVTKLGGRRYNATGKPYRKALIAAALKMGKAGVVIDRVRMSFEDYSAMCEASDDLKTIELPSANTVLGFKGVMIAGGPTGFFAAIPDEGVDSGHAFMENSKTWTCLSVDGELARVEKTDGLLFRHVSGEYAYEMEIVSAIQPAAEAPGEVMHIFNLGL